MERLCGVGRPVVLALAFLWSPYLSADDYSPIVEGVTNLCAPSGLVGVVKCLDGEGVTIASGDETAVVVQGTPPPEQPLACIARTYGAGRVLAMGHEAFFGNDLAQYDNTQFADNVRGWLDRSDTRKVLFRRTMWSGSVESHWVPRLKSQGCDVTFVDNGAELTSADLSGRGLLIYCTRWHPITAREIAAVVYFVNHGGGVLLTGVGWSFNWREQSLYPMNQIAERFGLYFPKGIIEDPDTNHGGDRSRPIFHWLYGGGPSVTVPWATLFRAQAFTDRSQRLYCGIPSSGGVQSIVLRWGVSDYPASPSSGMAVPGGVDGRFDVQPGTTREVMHTGLANGNEYYYSLFCRNGSGDYSLPVHLRTQCMFDMVPYDANAFEPDLLNCTPTASMSILGYWRSHTYHTLGPFSGIPASTVSLYRELKDAQGWTSTDGVSLFRVGPGLQAVANRHPAAGQTYSFAFQGGIPLYRGLLDWLGDGCPTLLFSLGYWPNGLLYGTAFTGFPEGHTLCGVGYQEWSGPFQVVQDGCALYVADSIAPEIKTLDTAKAFTLWTFMERLVPGLARVAAGSADIGPSGGTVQAGAGSDLPLCALAVPANALDETRTLTLEQGLEPAGTVTAQLRLEPSGLTFAEPATLTMQFAASDIPDQSTAEDMRIFRWNGTLWDLVPGDQTVDTGAMTVSASLDHLSTYAALPLTDPDGDGLHTLNEMAIGTAWFDPDSDWDGLSDGEEVAYDGDSSTFSPYDRRFNATGTDLDPRRPDTDEDGLSDGFELSVDGDPATHDPHDPAANPAGADLNPLRSDSDWDGVSDGAEVGYDGHIETYDPYDPASHPTGTDLNALRPDTDGDGFTDGQEIAAGADPLDAGSHAGLGAAGWAGLLGLTAVLSLWGAYSASRQQPSRARGR